ncbi:uncharacterized protein LOC124258215 [Haliotis rubra]|uniref:uncharacterized protein LOC124258215 n=1 Tax=Haliotis rubra TaxID=36100 RepID=UPI001EE542DA|nr:uncharacterized protein LOC124258215 [Haliotis rubra]
MKDSKCLEGKGNLAKQHNFDSLTNEYEPLGEKYFECITFKTFFLVALATAADISELHALDVNRVHFEWKRHGTINLARGKPATASSVYGTHPEVATDGLPYTDWKSGSCFAVAEGDNHPWWQVDLEAYSEVFEVAVTSRSDCCPERLHDFTLEVFRKNPATSTGARSALCGTYNGTVTEPGKTVSVECIRSVRGRYVRLRGTKDGEGDLLQFCEVKVFGSIIADGESNLARGKPATASSVYGPHPEVATDGLPYTDWKRGSCFTVAEGDDHPWWQVDLEAYSEVFEVAVTSRGDCCPERLHDFTLEVFRKNPATSTGARSALCGTYNGTVTEPGKTVSVECIRSVRGRYVRLRGTKDGEGDLLQFCEVKVFGSIIADGESNLARGKPATASSVYGPLPRVATDGLPNTDWGSGSCFAVAEGDDYPWWQVDLEAYSEVFEVAVTSRGDCCPERLHNFTLEVFTKPGARGCTVWILPWCGRRTRKDCHCKMYPSCSRAVCPIEWKKER